MKLFAKIVNVFQSLTIFIMKSSIIDDWLVSAFACFIVKHGPDTENEKQTW